MIPESLNAQQRAILQAAQARRIKAARLAHYQQLERAATAPDYFAHNAQRQAAHVPAARLPWRVRALRADHVDPRNDARGAAH